MHETYTISQIADIQAIKQRLAEHSRGIDRADLGMIEGVYHADATVNYGFFEGSAHEFAAILAQAQKGQPTTLHRTCLSWFKMDGDKAKSESAVLAYAQVPDAEGNPKQRLVFGRYLDRHEKREGDWKLSHRTYVLEANVNWPGQFGAGPIAPLSNFCPVGSQGSTDAGTAILALARSKFSNSKEGRLAMASENTQEALIDSVISKQQIADLLAAYSRGVDRADLELLLSIFHDDSVVIAGAFNGNGQDFAREITKIIPTAFKQSFHSVANNWVDVSGDDAVGESYVIAAVTMHEQDGKAAQVLTGGRYVDRFQRREGIWKFAERTFVCDWVMEQPSTDETGTGMYESLKLYGRPDKSDPVYSFWN